MSSEEYSENNRSIFAALEVQRKAIESQMHLLNAINDLAGAIALYSLHDGKLSRIRQVAYRIMDLRKILFKQKEKQQ